MGHRTSVFLRSIQYTLRTLQFLCSSLILAIYAYFLATLSNHSLPISTELKAVAGISGVGILYSVSAFFLLCCAPGQPFLSFILMLLDVAFFAAFIYVAAANKDGASSCSGEVNTPFGSGNADTNVRGANEGGWTALPSLGQACRMEKACLAVGIVAVILFFISFWLNLVLARQRKKEKRFGPSPANGYTSGYGKNTQDSDGITPKKKKRFSFLSRLGHKEKPVAGANGDDYLPTHATPDDMRQSFANNNRLQSTAVESNGYPDGGYGSGNGYGNLGGGVGNSNGYGNLGGGVGNGEPINKYQPYVPGTANTGAQGNGRYQNASTPYRQDYDDGVYDRVPL